MPNAPKPRGCRLVYVLGLPVLLGCCVGCITTVILVTENPVCSWPLMLLGYATLRQIRWVMIWLSTPAEKIVLAPGVEREPVLSLALRLLLSKQAERAQGHVGELAAPTKGEGVTDPDEASQ